MSKSKDDLRTTRRLQYLEAATSILIEDGVDALTMMAIAKRVDAAVGTIYSYFPSKSGLLAELQRNAFEFLSEVWQRALGRWTAELALEDSAIDLPLARVILYKDFNFQCRDAFPLQNELQAVFTKVSLDPEDLHRAMPAASELFARVYGVIEHAQSKGSLDTAASAFDRSILYGLSLHGVVSIYALPGAATFLDPEHYASMLTFDLLRSWGADASALETAAALTARVVEQHPLSVIAGQDDSHGVGGFLGSRALLAGTI